MLGYFIFLSSEDQYNLHRIIECTFILKGFKVLPDLILMIQTSVFNTGDKWYWYFYFIKNGQTQSQIS